MLYVYVALLAYLISAFVFIVDKYLLHSPIPKPFVYAFWVSVLSSFALVLIPFGVTFPEPEYLAITLSAGFLNFLGLIFLYKSIKASDISIASTKVGAFSVVTSFFFSILFFGGSLPLIKIGALAFFAGGIFLLAQSDRKILTDSLTGGIFLGISIVMLKWAFEYSHFINGIFWTRIGFTLAAVFSLVSPEARNEISESLKVTTNNSKAVFVMNKVLATFGAVVLYYAIKLGDVSLINALSGFQFLFVLLLALLFKRWVLKIPERTDRKILIRKAVGIILILIGFDLLLI